MPMKTRSKKNGKRAEKELSRASPMRRPGTPQTPLLLRGDSDEGEDPTSVVFERYARSKRIATFQKRLYSDSENSDSSPAKHTQNGINKEFFRLSKKRRVSNGERGDTTLATEATEVIRDETVGRDTQANEVFDDGHVTEDDEGNEEEDEEEDEEEVVDQVHEFQDEGEAGGDGRSDGEESEGDQSGDDEGRAGGGGTSAGEKSDGEESEGEQSDADDGRAGGGGAESEGERNGGERSAPQDVLFPGEDYNPPRTVNFTRGRCVRICDTSARVMIKYDVLTATKCPCEDRTCTKLMNVGTWGILGGGSRVCVHCGFKRKGGWEGCGYGFMGKEDLLRHLNTTKCRAKRGITVQKKTMKQILGEQVYYKINNPSYAFRKKDREGNVRKYYKCFICERVVGYRSRHSHHVNAKHGTELNEGEDSQNSE